MKNFLLNNKWVGFVSLLVYALIASAVVSKYGVEIVKQYTPMVVQEAEQFLPITLQEGEIIEPQNKIINQTYGDEKNGVKFNVVLDTTRDEFEATSLTEQGIYVSKKYMYGVSGQKTEIRSLSDFPNGTLDKEKLDAGADLFVKNTQKYMFPIYAIIALVSAMIAVLIYTVLMHWLMAIMFKVKFGFTLRINTLVYAIISIIAVLSGMYVGWLMMFGLMLLLNIGVNALEKSQHTA